MQSNLLNLTYEIELQPGEKLALPPTLIDVIGAGRWVVTIRPSETVAAVSRVRNHSAFLNSYVSEDEGLYDDYPTR
jgi:hypothetical protein